MNIMTSIIITLVSVGVVFVLLYILLMPTKKSVPPVEQRICPRCKKSDYRVVPGSKTGLGIIMGIGNPHYECYHCGYRGVFPVLIPEDEQKSSS